MPDEISERLNLFSHKDKELLMHIRAVIQKIAPEAVERITYGMPGFYYKNKYLIAYCAFKDHLSVFPGAGVIATLSKDLEGYATSKGTIQFTHQKPLTDELTAKIIQERIKEIHAK